MNIVIVGAGEVGSYLADSLSQQSHNVVVIEEDETIAHDMEMTVDAKVVHGNGSSVNTLLEAGVNSCDLFLALTSDNNVNLVSASIAKELNAGKVICRVHPELQREEWLFNYRGNFGIDYMFSTERLSAIQLAKFIRNPNSLVVEEVARGKIELQQVRIGENSAAASKTLIQLKAPERTRVASITRGGESFVPNANDALEPGDIVTIFGEPRKLSKLSSLLQGTEQEVDSIRVMIFGGGEYGFSLAQMLESWGCKVRILEKDKKRASQLLDRLANTTVINTDATVLSALEEEQAGEANFFVAVSDSDEDNVMSCLQAHTLGAENCLSLIHRADYADAISASGRHFGILAAVSPREATRRDVEKFLTEDDYHIVKELGAGEVIEVVVGKASIVGQKMVEEVEWPEGCVLVAKLNGIHADVPAPDDVIEAGDIVYAMVTPKAKKQFLKLVR